MKNTKVFDDGVSAADIKQGELGDCYLLSAMSVIAHSRPDFITRIFHSSARDFQENGLYTIMLYRNRKPLVLTIDDCFPTKSNVSCLFKSNLSSVETTCLCPSERE
jgi:calpain-15